MPLLFFFLMWQFSRPAIHTSHLWCRLDKMGAARSILRNLEREDVSQDPKNTRTRKIAHRELTMHHPPLSTIFVSVFMCVCVSQVESPRWHQPLVCEAKNVTSRMSPSSVLGARRKLEEELKSDVWPQPGAVHPRTFVYTPQLCSEPELQSRLPAVLTHMSTLHFSDWTGPTESIFYQSCGFVPVLAFH